MASCPPDPLRLIARIANELSERQIPFMLIGGQAVKVHGTFRPSAHIGITLGLAPADFPILQDTCQAAGLQVLPEPPERFVWETFVCPVRDALTGIRVDFIFSTLPYERQAIGRAIRVEFAGAQVPVATAEDLIIHQLFAGRPDDWDDAISVVRRTGPKLDWDYVEAWSRTFATVPGREEMPALVSRLRLE